ncbi:SH3 domain-containing protein [Roseomonas sp. JC162]|uniref:SH3 domain-containing protein n=1 Tax=Neoroseomonas marina TaxID=1232220 RepID=A0A848EEY5_9PROT|nr:SH3 domain-containing protein [Neoroseomonas marina]NMJ42037.1 SH3 domain-containing protein [Neoroseomonas marina]
MTAPDRSVLRLAGATAAVLGLAVAAGCAGGPGGGFASGGDGCRSQQGSFVGAGNPFVGQPEGGGTWTRARNNQNFGRSAGAGTAVLEASLAQENSDLDALQIAFDALLYCRWIEARTIRAELAAGRTTRPVADQRMAALRARLQRDLARAQQVLDGVQQRAAEREAAVEAVAPGTRDAERRARSETGTTRRVVAAATVPLRLRPESGAPEIGRVPAGTAVRVRPAQSGFALVEGSDGLRGYAPTGAFQIADYAAPRAAASGAGGQVRVLAASNIAKRDNFAESLSLAREAAVSGFELGA